MNLTLISFPYFHDFKVGNGNMCGLFNGNGYGNGFNYDYQDFGYQSRHVQQFYGIEFRTFEEN